jgi:hypothetical protein
MDRIDAVLLGDGDDVLDVEIPLNRLPALGLANQVRLIRLEPVE